MTRCRKIPQIQALAVQAILAARIDRLAPEAKRLVQAARRHRQGLSPAAASCHRRCAGGRGARPAHPSPGRGVPLRGQASALSSRGLSPAADLSDRLDVDVPEFHFTALALELHDDLGETILELGDHLYGCGLDRLLAEFLAVVKRSLVGLLNLLQFSKRLEFVHRHLQVGEIKRDWYGGCEMWFEVACIPGPGEIASDGLGYGLVLRCVR